MESNSQHFQVFSIFSMCYILTFCSNNEQYFFQAVIFVIMKYSIKWKPTSRFLFEISHSISFLP